METISSGITMLPQGSQNSNYSCFEEIILTSRAIKKLFVFNLEAMAIINILRMKTEEGMDYFHRIRLHDSNLIWVMYELSRAKLASEKCYLIQRRIFASFLSQANTKS